MVCVGVGWGGAQFAQLTDIYVEVCRQRGYRQRSGDQEQLAYGIHYSQVSKSS